MPPHEGQRIGQVKVRVTEQVVANTLFVRMFEAPAIVFRGCAADPRIFHGVPGESVAANFRCDSSKSDPFEILCTAMYNQTRVLLHGDAVLD